MLFKYTLPVVVCLLAHTCALQAQDTATLSGTVIDPAEAAVANATVKLIDLQHAAQKMATSTAQGLFLFDALRPGEYTIEVEREGFRTVRLANVSITARGARTLRIALTPVTVESSVITTSTPFEGLETAEIIRTSVTQPQLVEYPLVQRKLEPLVQLAPGVIGLRANNLDPSTNFYTVDGVAVDSLYRATTLDELKELHTETTVIQPELGRTPGAQIALRTRGGSNQWHGSAYEYFRNDRTNANNWFSNAGGLDRAKMQQNLFGGSLGGQLIENRTFFFAAYEGLRLKDPQTVTANVPSLSIRESASAALQPFLNAFPLPNSSTADPNVGVYRATQSLPATSNFGSFRIDHQFTPSVHAYARFSHAPSKSQSLGATSITQETFKNQAFTGGVTWARNAAATNDFRFSSTYTRADQQSTGPVLDILSGGVFTLDVIGLGSYTTAQRTGQRQRQYYLSDTYSQADRRRQRKFGFDFRRQTPTYIRNPYTAYVTVNGLAGLTSGTATAAAVTSTVPELSPNFTNASLFAQETIKATERATITYGVRWDANLSPTFRGSVRPGGLNDDYTVSDSRRALRPSWRNLAPRFGLAYQMDTTPGRELIFRSGVGLFYDINYIANTLFMEGAPTTAVNLLTSPAFPLSSANLNAPVLPATSPYSYVSSVDPYLKPPRVIEWNITLERYFGSLQSIEIGYAGTKAKRLLSNDYQAAQTTDDLYSLLRITGNSPRSAYQGLQIQYRRKMLRNLQFRASYTYSHATDNLYPSYYVPGLVPIYGSELANSAFDVRHMYTIAGSYQLPKPGHSAVAAVAGGWALDWIATGRTALPINVQTLSGEASDPAVDSLQAFWGLVQPGYNGQPVYIADANAPGGKRLNTGAFEASTSYSNGDLGRNIIRGFGLFQLDIALRRDFALSERFRLQFRTEGYNILNTPSFANLGATTGAIFGGSQFGIATRTQNQPRSLQFALRLQF